jgi:hypothetical protein
MDSLSSVIVIDSAIAIEHFDSLRLVYIRGDLIHPGFPKANIPASLSLTPLSILGTAGELISAPKFYHDSGRSCIDRVSHSGLATRFLIDIGEK